MKITKFVHSCLLVETPERTALFDPGIMSEDALDIEKINRLDDIFVTHEHSDHFSIDLVRKLNEKFPDARITSTAEVIKQLQAENIIAGNIAAEGVQFFNSPHEGHLPFIAPPEQIGVHYLNMLTHPGDSHSFTETKTIMALPITAPWGSTVTAVDLAINLQPKYVIPIHDWHWKDEVREMMYKRLEKLFEEEGITFFPMDNGGKPIEIETSP